MKRLFNILLFAVCFIVLGTGAALAAASSVNIAHKQGTVSVPVQPQRLVIMDFGMLDTLDAFIALGLVKNDVQVALPKANLPDYLSKYKGGEYVDIGGLKDFNLETIFAFKPDVIITSGRQQDFYQELSAIAPVWQIDNQPPDYLRGTMQNIKDLGRIFGVEEQAAIALANLSEAVRQVHDVAAAKKLKALVLLTNDGKISAYGSGSRFGIIFDALGFEQADSSIRVGIHGQLVNFEYIAERNPDIIFVVDRSIAVSGKADGVRILNNDLVNGTRAAKNGKIVSLDPSVWYLSGGGLVSLRMMVDEIGQVLGR